MTVYLLIIDPIYSFQRYSSNTKSIYLEVVHFKMLRNLLLVRNLGLYFEKLPYACPLSKNIHQIYCDFRRITCSSMKPVYNQKFCLLKCSLFLYEICFYLRNKISALNRLILFTDYTLEITVLRRKKTLLFDLCTIDTFL